MRFPADQYCHRNHDDLRGDDAGRHEQGLASLIGLGELFTKQWQHRRIAKLNSVIAAVKEQRRFP
jgi:hypothetical protein